MKKLLFFFLVLIFVISCASNKDDNETGKNKDENHFSPETNQAFEMLERGGSYYLKKPPSKKIIPPQLNSKTDLNKGALGKTRKSNESLIEINQHLAFYCMKKSKNPSQNIDDSKCQSYVNSVMKNCQSLYPNLGKKLITCIKSKLKKRA